MLTSTPQSAHTIIGSGSYGCVTKPAFKCKGQMKAETKYEISKITNKDGAKREHSIMSYLRKDDELEQYILDSKECQPMVSSHINGSGPNHFKRTAEECRERNIGKSYVFTKDFNLHNDAWLLQMKDGGKPMYIYENQIIDMSKKRQKKFLQAISKIIHCLQLFQKKGLMHCDIKLDNILYDENSGNIKIIDFGLAANTEKYKEYYLKKTKPIFEGESKYYPPEMKFSNQTKFNKYFEEKETSHKNCNENCIQCQSYAGYEKKEYETFLDDSAKTFDSYSLAYWLEKMFEDFFSKNLFSKENDENDLNYSCMELMTRYCHKEVKTREKDLGKWKNDYDQILLKYDYIFEVDTVQENKEFIEHINIIDAELEKITSELEHSTYLKILKLIEKFNKATLQYLENMKMDEHDINIPEFDKLIRKMTEKKIEAKNFRETAIVVEREEAEEARLAKEAKAKELAAKQKELEAKKKKDTQEALEEYKKQKYAEKEAAEAEKIRLKKEADKKRELANKAKKKQIADWKAEAAAAAKQQKTKKKPPKKIQIKGGKTKRKPKLRTRNKKLRSNKKRRHGKKTYKKRKTTSRK